MGKSKVKMSAKNKKTPLSDEINEGKVVKPKNRQKIRLRAEESSIVDSKTSKKILSQARKQHLEMVEATSGASASPSTLFPKKGIMKNKTLKKTSVSDSEEDDEYVRAFQDSDNTKQEFNEVDFYDDIQIAEDDIKAMELFQNSNDDDDGDKPTANRFKSRKLCDLIMEKIAEKQADLSTKFSDDGGLFRIEDIDPRVQEMYENVRDIMKRYRSGKVPKAFKIIPKLRNWEQILYITEPHNWSAAAMFQGTRTFCSVLSQNMAQRFYNLVLLPRVRDDLAEYKRLNVHLYNALRKALFKPAAFMKGIILPLLESGDCTIREAIIFGSVIARSSIPVLHSSACLLKICEMEYSPPNSIFIKIFLDKRYALPYRVVDAAVAHFIRFEHDKRELPVLWHQSLLTFIQRYKNDISSEQKEVLFGLIRKKTHYKITAEIRRELQAAKCRDVEMMEPDRNDVEMEIKQEFSDDDYMMNNFNKYVSFK